MSSLFRALKHWPFALLWSGQSLSCIGDFLYQIALAFGFSAAIGLFFGIYPANRAACLKPIEALRYE